MQSCLENMMCQQRKREIILFILDKRWLGRWGMEGWRKEVLLMCINTWWDRMKETDFSHKMADTEFKLKYKDFHINKNNSKKVFLLFRGGQKPEQVSQRGCEFSTFGDIRSLTSHCSRVTCFHWPCLNREVSLGHLGRWLPTYIILAHLPTATGTCCF